MAYAPTNWQDGVTPVNAVNMNKLEQGLAAAVGIPADVVVPAANHLIRNRFGGADANPGFRLMGDGRLEWGPGATVAPDVTLKRDAIALGKGYMTLDGGLWIDTLLEVGGNINGWKASPDGAAFSFPTVQLRNASGTPSGIFFGSGAAGLDAGIYRLTGGVLSTNAAVRFSHDWGIWTQGSTPEASAMIAHYVGADEQARIAIQGDGMIQWGPGGSTPPDTTLFRTGPGWLGTGALEADQLFSYGPIEAHQSPLLSSRVTPTQFSLAFYTTGASVDRFTIQNDGKMAWGDGAVVTDTSLSRIAAGTLHTPGSLNIGTQLAVGGEVVGANGKWFIAAAGDHQWGPGDWSRDTNLYRYAAGILATDGQIYLRGGNNSYLAFQWPGEQARFFIGPSGGLNWGPGNVTQDTNLYRSAANVLKTDGQLWVGNNLALVSDAAGLYFGSSFDVSLTRAGAGQLALSGGLLWIANRPNATDVVFQTGPTTGLGFFFTAAGSMNWAAPGSGADTNLYRESVGVLRTSGEFYVGKSIVVGRDDAAARLYFSPSVDTYISRLSAGVLGINGVAIATGGAVGYGTSLPASPVDGQEYILVDSVTNPTYQWRFRWNAGQSALGYKWEFVGGAAAVVQVDQIVDSDTGGAYVNSFGGSPGPDFTVPRAGIYDVMIQFQTGADNYRTVYMSYDIGGTSAQDADAVWGRGGNYQTGGFATENRPVGTRRKQIAAAGTLLHCVYKCGPGTGRIQNRVISVLPVRVI